MPGQGFTRCAVKAAGLQSTSLQDRDIIKPCTFDSRAGGRSAGGEALMYSTCKELLAGFHKQPQCVNQSDCAGLGKDGAHSGLNMSIYIKYTNLM